MFLILRSTTMNKKLIKRIIGTQHFGSAVQ